MQLTSGDLDLLQQPIGMRFSTLSIPPGALITEAYLELTAEDNNSDTASLTILGEASDDPATFTTTNSNITGRPTTAASVAWTLPAWTAGQAYQSPDITAIIQEIVNRPGWNSGNALVLIFTTSTGERDAVSYDQNSSSAPLLHVAYTSGSSDLNNQIVDADEPSVETTAVTPEPSFGQRVVNSVRQLLTRLVNTFENVKN